MRYYKMVLLAILLCQGTVSKAQTGPGGIQSTDGTSDLVLWLDANQITNVYNQNNVTTWSDASGYANDCSISGAGSKPNLQKSTLNGFPVLTFKGDEYLDGNFGGALNAPITIIAVPYFNTTQSTLNDYVFSIGKQQTDGRMCSISRRMDEGGGAHLNEYYSFNGNQPEYGPTIATATWYIFTQYQTTSDPEHVLYLDGGSPQTTTNNTTNTLNTDGNYSVGRWADGGSTFLDGSIAEIIVFSKVLNETERNIVQSYLSAKYAISITDDRYIGDAVPNYDLDVVGIGRVSSTDLHSASYSRGIRLAIASFSDGDYLMAGHNTTENSVNTADASDAGGNLQARWNRQWWLDLTNGSGSTVQITFDLSEGDLIGNITGTSTDYKLIHRTATSGNWTISSAIAAVAGDQVIFTGVDLSAIGGDGYYTLGTIDNTNSPIGDVRSALGNDGPGGIGSTDGSSNLELWFDMDDLVGETNDFILALEDKSGNNNNASESADFPLLVTDAVNGHNAISFDGANTKIGGTITGGLSAPATIISVAYFDQSTQGSTDNDYVISIGASAATNDHTSLSRRQSGSNADRYYAFDGTFPATSAGVRISGSGETIDGQTWTMISQTQQSGAPRHAAYVDGAPFTVDDFSGDLLTDGTYMLGRWTLTTTNYLSGDIAEVMVYNRKLTTAELNILHAYLAAKYTITITGDVYAGDNNGVSDPNYDLDVAGIGTESDGAKSSASSAGLNITQETGFDNGDYLMIGHGLEVNTVTTSDITLSSGTIDERLSRMWYFDLTDDNTAPETQAVVDITFDYSEAGLKLFPSGSANNFKIIYRAGTSGDWTVIAEGASFANDAVTFQNISLTDGDGYYTVATANNTSSPLPVTWMSFEASVDPGLITLEWETGSEINNSHFEVQRAIDDVHFESIGKVGGAGNHGTGKRYMWRDVRPLPGIAYYRLKQVDFDGQFEYSKKIRVVSKEPFPQLYPNPGSGFFWVSGQQSGTPVNLEIRSLTGEQILVTSIPEHGQVDLSILTPGMYLARIMTGNLVHTQRLIIR